MANILGATIIKNGVTTLATKGLYCSENVDVKVNVNTNVVVDADGLTKGQKLCLLRARQMRDIEFTPIAQLPSEGGYISAGTLRKGLLYSSVRDTDKFIGFNVSIHTFMTALQNPKSVLYTKENTQDAAGLWYGTNCSEFISYAYGWDYFGVTATVPFRDCMMEIEISDIQPCDVINWIAGVAGHLIMITDVERDDENNIVSVELTEDAGSCIHSTVVDYDTFITSYIDEGYKAYRNMELYKTPYEPLKYIPLDDEIIETIVYSDLCTDLGDKATILTSESITLNPINTDGYTAIKLYKDGVEIGSYDVADVTLSNLEAGKYTACLYPFADNASTSFIVSEATVTKSGNRISFNGTDSPLYIMFRNASGYTLKEFKLTDDDIARSYKDIDYTNTSASYITVPFKNEYGINVARCDY